MIAQALGVGEPRHGHGGGPGDIAIEHRWAHAAGAIALDPAVGGGKETIEKLREVLNHVIALGFTVHQHIQPQGFLTCDHIGNLGAHGVIILCSGDQALAELRTCGADLSGLGEGTDRGGWQRRQVQCLILRRLPVLKSSSFTICVRDLLVLSPGKAGMTAIGKGSGGGIEKCLINLAGQGTRESCNLSDLLLAEATNCAPPD